MAIEDNFIQVTDRFMIDPVLKLSLSVGRIVKQIDDALTAFKNMVSGYLDQANKALAEGTEFGLEYVTGSAIEWTAEESAAWVGEGNDILVGDDLSLLIGSEENNWLVTSKNLFSRSVYAANDNSVILQRAM